MNKIKTALNSLSIRVSSCTLQMSVVKYIEIFNTIELAEVFLIG